MRVACLLFKPSPSRCLTDLAEAGLNWSPQIAVSSEAIFFEIGKCKNIYSEDEFLLGINKLLKSFNQTAQITIADDLPTSLALARFQKKDKASLPIESLQDYLHPFGQDTSTEKISLTLRDLGVLTLGTFLRLPRQSLPSRFGKLGALLALRAQDASAMPWPQLKLKEVILEKHDFAFTDNIQTIEPLLFVLKNLVDRAMLRARGRGERASQISIQMELEKTSLTDETKRCFLFDFPLPQSSTLNILSILHDKIEADFLKKPLSSPIESLSFKISETAPGNFAQRDFFQKKEEEQEAWASLIARLSEKLGKSHTFLASPTQSYRPEGNWAKTLSPVQDLALPYPPRPLRLLKKPRPLTQIDNLLMDSGKTWKILNMEGPEHISGDWWKDPFCRKYFKISTHTGELLWIYHTPKSKQLFLHGYFD